MFESLSKGGPVFHRFNEQFDCFGHLLNHENSLLIEQTSRHKELEVKNQCATLSGNNVVKYTEIHVEDKIIKIFDTYKCDSSSKNPPQQDSSSQTVPQPSSRHFSRQNLMDKKAKRFLNTQGEEEHRVRDTKNLVKNICKLFQNWIEDDPLVKLHLGERVRDFFEQHHRYNNNLIRTLARDSCLRSSFMTFC